MTVDKVIAKIIWLTFFWPTLYMCLNLFFLCDSIESKNNRFVGKHNIDLERNTEVMAQLCE